MGLETDAMTWSEETQRIFGLKPGEFGGTHEAFLGNLLPEDRQLLTQRNRKLWRRTSRSTLIIAS